MIHDLYIPPTTRPVIALNCSHVPGCHLDGVTITAGAQYGGACAKPAPAIRVYSGTVHP